MLQFNIATEKGERLLMRLFSKKGHAVKNWHTRALLIDPKKTKLTLIKTHEVSADITRLFVLASHHQGLV